MPPATERTVVEIVKFQTKGLTEAQARTKAMGVAIGDASTKAETFARLLNDPRYDRFAKRLDEEAKKYELLSLRTRNAAVAQRLADGSAVRHLRSVTRLNEEHAKLERRMQAIARYGERWGNFAFKYGAAATRIGGAVVAGAGAVSATGIGLARQGFQGTVEQNRFDLEMKMIGRELAGVMKPVMEVMTRGARRVREYLERLSGSGQNVVMGGLLAGGAASSAWALRSLVTGGIAARMAGMAGTAATGLGAAEAAGIGATAAAGSGWAARYAGRAARFGVTAAPFASIAHGVSEAERRGGKWADYKSAALQNLYTLGTSSIGGDPLRWAYRQFGAERGLDDTRSRINRGLGASDYERPGTDTRRYPSLAGGGFEEGDEMYKRFNAAIAAVGGDVKQPTEAERKIIEALGEIRDRLPRDTRMLARPE